MQTVTVKSPSFKYPIYIDSSYDSLAEAFLEANLLGRKAVVITDSIVKELYLKQIVTELSNFFSQIYSTSFTAGEQNKNLDTVKELYTFMEENNIDRKSVIIALGGGITGDMAGFAAATYLRGLPLVQIPTTLLSQVDSSVGGKVGVDFMGNKNFVGSFYQPRFVYINTEVLNTLDNMQFSAGLGEVVKHGLIMDSGYYHYIAGNTKKIIEKTPKIMEKLISKSCKIKAGVVIKDEKETGLREILNFGHTFGHSLESLSNFEILHGHCVFYGMRAAMYMSYLQGGIDKAALENLDELMREFQVPYIDMDIDSDSIYNQMFKDKKVIFNMLNIVMLKKIGTSYVNRNADKDNVKQSIEYMMKWKCD